MSGNFRPRSGFGMGRPNRPQFPHPQFSRFPAQSRGPRPIRPLAGKNQPPATANTSTNSSLGSVPNNSVPSGSALIASVPSILQADTKANQLEKLKDHNTAVPDVEDEPQSFRKTSETKTIGKQSSFKKPPLKKDMDLTKGTKTGMSLSDFLNSRKSGKTQTTVVVSKTSLSDFIWDRDSGKSWDDIKEKFGLSSDELGVHLIKMKTDKTSEQPKGDYDEENSEEINMDSSISKIGQSKQRNLRESQFKRKSKISKGGTKNTVHSESNLTCTNTKKPETDVMGADEISLSDFIWDHESGKSWESIKRKFGLESDELADVPLETNKGIQDRTETECFRHTATKMPKLTHPVAYEAENLYDQCDMSTSDMGSYSQTSKTIDDRSRTGGFRHTSSNSEKSSFTATKMPKMNHLEAYDSEKLYDQHDVTSFDPGSFSQTSTPLPSSREHLKRRSYLEETEHIKKQRLSASPTPQGGGKPNTKVFIGNVYMSIKKNVIEKMFEFIPGIVSWSLARHRTAFANTCIIVEMVSELAAMNLQKTLKDMELGGRQLWCRFANPTDETVNIMHPTIKSDSSTPSTPALETKTWNVDGKKLLLSDLPKEVTKKQVDGLLKHVFGIASYRLRHHKDDRNLVAVIIEMTSEHTAENGRKILARSSIAGHKISCRFWLPTDEEDFTGEDENSWEEIRIQSRVETRREKKEAQQEQKRKEMVVSIGNLPLDTSKADLIDYISDLTYKSIDLHPGDRLKHAYAYVHFDCDEDAKTMVDELEGGLFFGNVINVKLEHLEIGTGPGIDMETQKASSGATDLGTSMPMRSTSSASRTLAGNSNTRHVPAGILKKPPGNTESGSGIPSLLGDFGNDMYSGVTSAGIKQTAGNAHLKTGQPVGILKNSSSLGNTDFGTRVPGQQSIMSISSTDVTTTGSFARNTYQGTGSVNQTGKPVGILKNTTPGNAQFGNRNTAGYTITGPRNQDGSAGPRTRMLAQNTDLKTNLITQTSAGDPGLRIRQPAGILKNSSSSGQMGKIGSTPGQMGKMGSTPGQMGKMGSAPGQMGKMGSTPGQMGKMGSTPGQMGKMGSTPGQMGKTGSAPGQMGKMGSTPGQMGNMGSTPGQMGKMGSTPGQMGKMGPAPGQMGKMGSTPGQMRNVDSTPGQLGKIGSTPGQMGNMGPPGQMRNMGSTPGQMGKIGSTPGQMGNMGPPGQMGKMGSTPGQVGKMGLTPGQMGKMGSTPGQMGKMEPPGNTHLRTRPAYKDPDINVNKDDGITPTSVEASPESKGSKSAETEKEGRSQQQEGGSELDRYLEESDIAVIGLDYITEFSVPNQQYPTYKCSMCEANPRGSGIVHHLSSQKHRLKYLQRRLPKLYEKLEAMNLKKSDLSVELNKHAIQIEKRNGRGKITVVNEQKKEKPVLSFNMEEEEESSAEEPKKDSIADLLSRIKEYKQKMQTYESSQKKDEENDSKRTEEATGSSATNKDTDSSEVSSMPKETAESIDKAVKELELTKDPVLGLDSITYKSNTLKPDRPYFSCSLCDCRSYMTLLVKHAAGYSHIMMYFRKNALDIYQMINFLSTRSEQLEMARQKAEEMEKKCGRGTLSFAEKSHPTEGEAQDPKVIPATTAERNVPSPSASQSSSPAKAKPKPVSFVIQPAPPVAAPPLSLAPSPLVAPPSTVASSPVSAPQPAMPMPVVPAFLAKSLAINVSSVNQMTGKTVSSASQPEKSTTIASSQVVALSTTMAPTPVVALSSAMALSSAVAPPSVMAPPTVVAPPPFMAPPPMVAPMMIPWVPPPMNIPPPTLLPPPIMLPPPTMVKPPTMVPPPIEEEPKQDKHEVKMTDRKMRTFSYLRKEHEKKPAAERKTLLGLSSCTEILHPYDTELPLYQCDLCRQSFSYKEIIPHVVWKVHLLEFFKQRYPDLYPLIEAKAGKDQDEFLSKCSKQIESTDGQETIGRHIIAKDDTPWKMWKTDTIGGKFIKTEALIKEGIAIEAIEVTASSTDDTTPDVADGKMDIDDDNTSIADKPLQFEVNKGPSVPKVREREGVAISDLVGEARADEAKWMAVNAEIEKRIKSQVIIVLERPSKFLKTYKPFLDKFPVIGLESLTEFQKPDQNIDPWYLCYLCHKEVDWKNIVEHVVTLRHRCKYMAKEHPKLYELLSTSYFASTSELQDRIEEFSNRVAKPPSENIVRVMLELTVSRQELDLAMKEDFATKADLAIRADLALKEDLALKAKTDKRKRELRKVEPAREADALHRGQSDQQRAVPIMKDYHHQSLRKDKPTEKEKMSPTALKKRKMLVLKPKFSARFGGKTKRAIVGLQHLTEYQSEDPSIELYYFCALCDAKLGTGGVMHHLMGLKHRILFFRKYRPDVYKVMIGKSSSPMKRSDVNTLAEQYALEYEQEHGRSEVKVVMEIPDDEDTQEQSTRNRDRRDRRGKSPKSLATDDRRKHSQEMILGSRKVVQRPGANSVAVQTSKQPKSSSDIKGPISDTKSGSQIETVITSISTRGMRNRQLKMQQQKQIDSEQAQNEHENQQISPVTSSVPGQTMPPVSFVPPTNQVVSVTNQMPIPAQKLPIQSQSTTQPVVQPQVQQLSLQQCQVQQVQQQISQQSDLKQQKQFQQQQQVQLQQQQQLKQLPLPQQVQLQQQQQVQLQEQIKQQQRLQTPQQVQMQQPQQLKQQPQIPQPQQVQLQLQQQLKRQPQIPQAQQVQLQSQQQLKQPQQMPQPQQVQLQQQQQLKQPQQMLQPQQVQLQQLQLQQQQMLKQQLQLNQQQQLQQLQQAQISPQLLQQCPPTDQPKRGFDLFVAKQLEILKQQELDKQMELAKEKMEILSTQQVTFPAKSQHVQHQTAIQQNEQRQSALQQANQSNIILNQQETAHKIANAPWNKRQNPQSVQSSVQQQSQLKVTRSLPQQLSQLPQNVGQNQIHLQQFQVQNSQVPSVSLSINSSLTQVSLAVNKSNVSGTPSNVLQGTVQTNVQNPMLQVLGSKIPLMTSQVQHTGGQPMNQGQQQASQQQLYHQTLVQQSSSSQLSATSVSQQCLKDSHKSDTQPNISISEPVKQNVISSQSFAYTTSGISPQTKDNSKFRHQKSSARSENSNNSNESKYLKKDYVRSSSQADYTVVDDEFDAYKYRDKVSSEYIKQKYRTKYSKMKYEKVADEYDATKYRIPESNNKSVKVVYKNIDDQQASKAAHAGADSATKSTGRVFDKPSEMSGKTKLTNFDGKSKYEAKMPKHDAYKAQNMDGDIVELRKRIQRELEKLDDEASSSQSEPSKYTTRSVKMKTGISEVREKIQRELEKCGAEDPLYHRDKHKTGSMGTKGKAANLDPGTSKNSFLSSDHQEMSGINKEDLEEVSDDEDEWPGKEQQKPRVESPSATLTKNKKSENQEVSGIGSNDLEEVSDEADEWPDDRKSTMHLKEQRPLYETIESSSENEMEDSEIIQNKAKFHINVKIENETEEVSDDEWSDAEEKNEGSGSKPHSPLFETIESSSESEMEMSENTNNMIENPSKQGVFEENKIEKNKLHLSGAKEAHSEVLNVERESENVVFSNTNSKDENTKIQGSVFGEEIEFENVEANDGPEIDFQSEIFEFNESDYEYIEEIDDIEPKMNTVHNFVNENEMQMEDKQTDHDIHELKVPVSEMLAVNVDSDEVIKKNRELNEMAEKIYSKQTKLESKFMKVIDALEPEMGIINSVDNDKNMPIEDKQKDHDIKDTKEPVLAMLADNADSDINNKEIEIEMTEGIHLKQTELEPEMFELIDDIETEMDPVNNEGNDNEMQMKDKRNHHDLRGIKVSALAVLADNANSDMNNKEIQNTDEITAMIHSKQAELEPEMFEVIDDVVLEPDTVQNDGDGNEMKMKDKQIDHEIRDRTFSALAVLADNIDSDNNNKEIQISDETTEIIHSQQAELEPEMFEVIDDIEPEMVTVQNESDGNEMQMKDKQIEPDRRDHTVTNLAVRADNASKDNNNKEIQNIDEVTEVIHSKQTELEPEMFEVIDAIEPEIDTVNNEGNDKGMQINDKHAGHDIRDLKVSVLAMFAENADSDISNKEIQDIDNMTIHLEQKELEPDMDTIYNEDYGNEMQRKDKQTEHDLRDLKEPVLEVYTDNANGDNNDKEIENIDETAERIYSKQTEFEPDMFEVIDDIEPEVDIVYNEGDGNEMHVKDKQTDHDVKDLTVPVSDVLVDIDVRDNYIKESDNIIEMTEKYHSKDTELDSEYFEVLDDIEPVMDTVYDITNDNEKQVRDNRTEYDLKEVMVPVSEMLADDAGSDYYMNKHKNLNELAEEIQTEFESGVFEVLDEIEPEMDAVNNVGNDNQMQMEAQQTGHHVKETKLPVSDIFADNSDSDYYIEENKNLHKKTERIHAEEKELEPVASEDMDLKDEQSESLSDDDKVLQETQDFVSQTVDDIDLHYIDNSLNENFVTVDDLKEDRQEEFDNDKSFPVDKYENEEEIVGNEYVTLDEFDSDKGEVSHNGDQDKLNFVILDNSEENLDEMVEKDSVEEIEEDISEHDIECATDFIELDEYKENSDFDSEKDEEFIDLDEFVTLDEDTENKEDTSAYKIGDKHSEKEKTGSRNESRSMLYYDATKSDLPSKSLKSGYSPDEISDPKDRSKQKSPIANHWEGSSRLMTRETLKKASAKHRVRGSESSAKYLGHAVKRSRNDGNRQERSSSRPTDRTGPGRSHTTENRIQHSHPSETRSRMEDDRSQGSYHGESRSLHTFQRDSRSQHSYQRESRSHHSYHEEPRSHRSYHEEPRSHHSDYEEPRSHHSQHEELRLKHSYYEESRSHHSQHEEPRSQHSFHEEPRSQHSYYEESRSQGSYHDESRSQHSYHEEPRSKHSYQEDSYQEEPRSHHRYHDESRSQHSYYEEPRSPHSYKDESYQEDPRSHHPSYDEPRLYHEELRSKSSDSRSHHYSEEHRTQYHSPGETRSVTLHHSESRSHNYPEESRSGSSYYKDSSSYHSTERRSQHSKYR